MSLHDARITAVQREDFLRYDLPSFQRKIDRARALVANALAVIDRPWLAFSGGKDSLVTLALVREQRLDIPVVWGDDELEYPETVDYLPRLAQEWSLNLMVAHGTWGWPPGNHAGWFVPWSERPFWREPLPGSIRLDTEEVRHWMPGRWFDGVFLGLRADERPHRQVHLRKGGLLQQTALGWQCNPIGWWSVDEVWALIAGWKLPYNPVYDRLAGIGVPREQQRVGPLPLSPGWILRAGWPDLYRRLVERYGWRWG